MSNNRNISNTIDNQPATGKYKYSNNTLKYYENLKNVGGFNENLPNVGTGIVGSPLCGDVMKVQLFFGDNDIISDVKYKVFGCVSAIASMEMVSELLKGMTIEQALSIRNEDVANSLELSELKRHCSVLAKECIEAAVNNYKEKQSKSLNPINITKEAADKIKELLKEHNSIGISISVISGGCSGIDYTLGYVNEEQVKENNNNTSKQSENDSNSKYINDNEISEQSNIKLNREHYNNSKTSEQSNSKLNSEIYNHNETSEQSNSEYINNNETSEISSNKLSVIEVDGIKVYYDPSIELLLNGVNIDLFDNGFGSGFIVTNKNHMPCANCTCGCGMQ